MSLKLILNECDEFKTYSSLKLNTEKLETHWLGLSKNDQMTPNFYNWVDVRQEKIRALGIYESFTLFKILEIFRNKESLP